MLQQVETLLKEVLENFPEENGGNAAKTNELPPYKVIDDAQVVLVGIEGAIPYKESISGNLYLTPEGQAAFIKAQVRRWEPNPIVFQGKYLKCRQKKNGNYQVTSCMTRDTIDKWTDANGKVNLRDIYLYQQAELKQILMIIEQRHSHVKSNEADSERCTEAAPTAELPQRNGAKDSEFNQEEKEVKRA